MNKSEFQSTHPVWGATPASDPTLPPVLLFQSTHPVWGATAREVIAGEWGDGISIHAPRVGCDPPMSFAQFLKSTISIHAPRVGCDLNESMPYYNKLYISIHAPRVGCDNHIGAYRGGCRNFNPRTPCGVRLWEPVI